MACEFCAPGELTVLCGLGPALMIAPHRPHLEPADGGHLTIVPRRHIPSRRDAQISELVALDLLSVAASLALESVLDTTWTNYQENGNWSSEHPEKAHLHLHVYGRAPRSDAQTFGEALILPRRSDWQSKLEFITPDKQQLADMTDVARRYVLSRIEDLPMTIGADWRA